LPRKKRVYYSGPFVWKRPLAWINYIPLFWIFWL
jgi:hypothetical protein